MTHSLYVKRNSMNDSALSVYCTCGNLYEVAGYVVIPDTDDEETGVPLSVLMDIAEAHQNEEENR